ncbi:HpcH/HpaI aldolase/citrate lyase family protein [Pseudomonas aeruginosa]
MSLRKKVCTATTFLFVPGNKPERFAKAIASGADVVILDLEDAVGVDEKDRAREHVIEWLKHHPDSVVVRINPRVSREAQSDLRALRGLVSVVMVPKTESELDVRDTVDLLGRDASVIALIETARGVLQADRIATANGVIRLALGNVDLAADIGIDPDDRHALLPVRSRLSLVSAAAGLCAPVDGVTTVLTDAALTIADAKYARSMGFTGKLCIHPSQVAPTREAYLPSADEIKWARSIVALSVNDSVAKVNGEMIDRPVVSRAQHILAQVQ